MCISVSLGEEIPPPTYLEEEASPATPVEPTVEYISPLKLTGPITATPS